jgi:hypothetical protein
VNLLGDNIDTVKENTGNLIDASKVVGLEVIRERNKYGLVYHHQNAGQNRDIKYQRDYFKMCHISTIWE